MANPVANSTLDDMAAYYRARAAEYDEWFYRRGRFDHGTEANSRWVAEAETVFAALDALQIRGAVLELAPGTGIWTERLARTADSITAVDASAEMVAINRAKVAKEAVTYVLADLFAWQPTRTFDAAVFGFWISHVPHERLAGFLATVAAALRPGGRVFFVDGRREPTSTAVDHQLPAADSQVMTRLLNDGRAFQIVKNFYDPATLTAECAAAGLDVTVRETPTYFIYGFGARREQPVSA
ncbi:MAG TPA: class I SAM-dependent methyltransferase [Chloroflexota bacterium]|jgi:demethylmenaquinone methyltransferase/2-methoxy-6-polyprenyl-1,4-benzoquinol methylase|nr:class I SAM-dependent methyltransferase [Chloroflexota bacterium]